MTLGVVAAPSGSCVQVEKEREGWEEREEREGWEEREWWVSGKGQGTGG
jgi:hypothetical protein